ncbi:MAG: hypothetical protein IJO33_05030 [Bacilli bacterium]|nr:hypothetical protein [Bacilli bacterium]
MPIEEFRIKLIELLKKLTNELCEHLSKSNKYLFDLDSELAELKISPEMTKVLKENNVNMIGFNCLLINDKNEQFLTKKEMVYRVIRLYEYSLGLRLNVDCFATLEIIINSLGLNKTQKDSILAMFINIFAKYYTTDKIVERLSLTKSNEISTEEISMYALRLRTHLDKIETIFKLDGKIEGSEKDESVFNTLTKFLMLSPGQASRVMNVSEHKLMSQKYSQEKIPVKKAEIIPGNTKTSEDIIAQMNANNKIYLQLRNYIDLNNYKILYAEYIDEQLTIEILSLCEKIKISEENKKLILIKIAKHNELMEANLLKQKIAQIKKEEEFNRVESIYNFANYIISSEYFNNDGLYKYVIFNLTYLVQSIDREIISYAKNEVTYEDYKELVAMAWCDLYEYLKEVRIAFNKIDELARLRLKSNKKGTV